MQNWANLILHFFCLNCDEKDGTIKNISLDKYLLTGRRIFIQVHWKFNLLLRPLISNFLSKGVGSVSISYQYVGISYAQ